MGAKFEYGTIQTVSITLTSLPNGTVAISSAIDNSSTKYIVGDIEWTFKTTTVSVAPLLPVVAVFILRSVDGGVTFDDTNNMTLLSVFKADVDNSKFIYTCDTEDTTPQLPEYFKLALINNTGADFDNISANFNVRFLGKRCLAIPDLV